MFKSPEDETRICNVLKAFVEEWGATSVTVGLPQAWRNPSYSLGPTKLEFNTLNEIEIRVDHGNVHLKHVLELAAV